MMSERRFASFVQASAWYDLIVTAPFATPWTLAALFSVMTWAHSGLGLSGQIPDLSVGTTLFANLLGSVVVVWSLARIILPVPVLGRLDAVARCLFACWLIFAIVNGASTLIIFFAGMEIVWAIPQLLPYRRQSKAQ